MRNETARSAAISAYASETFDSEADRIIATALLYGYIVSAIRSDSSNDASSVASSYYKIYKSAVSEMKASYISYPIIVSKIEASYKASSFSDLSETQISEIMRLYRDKTKKVDFSVNMFSQYMYGIANMSISQHSKLAAHHYECICPIVRRYVDGYGAKASDMTVVSAYGDFPDNPGKEIIFYINNIPSAKIVSDIENGFMPINYYSVSIKGDYVDLMLSD
jgi:hypothetical protein